MKVLFMVRPDILKVMAGDTVQIFRTKEKLEKLKVVVDISTDLNPGFAGYDLVHGFNLTRIRETYSQVLAASKKGMPLLLSPIYWNQESFLKKEKPGALRKWQDNMIRRREILEKADMLLPNGQGEYECLVQDTGVEKPYRLIPNGVGDIVAPVEPGAFNREHGFYDYVLMVARFSRRKNQLKLIKAQKDLGFPLVFIGPVNDTAYFQQCRATASQRILFLPSMTPSRLARAYRDARLHALPSYFETPGLVSLEAGVQGSRILTTSIGTAREYFGDYAHYCNPYDLHSLKEALHEAFHSPPPRDLPQHIRGNYTWERAAEETYKAYENLLAGFVADPGELQKGGKKEEGEMK